MHKAFDCIEDTLASDPPGAPAALLTISESPKFYSNGIDPAWMASPSTPADSIAQWNDLTMPAFARPILLPIPTLTAINGHAFGAGMMHALCHDYRLQRQERGFQCAIEIAIGIKTPPPELTLFRHSIPASAFHDTCLLGKRWSGDEAAAAGIVARSVPGEQLLAEALKEAAQQAKLGANRSVMKYYKRELKGYVAEEILTWEFADGRPKSSRALPKGLQRHVDEQVARSGGGQSSWGARFRDFESGRFQRRNDAISQARRSFL